MNDCVSSLQFLGISVDDWDPPLIYLISMKLADNSFSLWEHSLSSHSHIPTGTEMIEFLVRRPEAVERMIILKSSKVSFCSEPKLTELYVTHDSFTDRCKLCNVPHST